MYTITSNESIINKSTNCLYYFYYLCQKLKIMHNIIFYCLLISKVHKLFFNGEMDLDFTQSLYIFIMVQ